MSHKKVHQIAVYVDVTHPSESFENRVQRFVVGSLNLPNTMKSDIYLLGDKVLQQVADATPIKFPPVAEVTLNEKAAAVHAAELGYVGFMIMRPISKSSN